MRNRQCLTLGALLFVTALWGCEGGDPPTGPEGNGNGNGEDPPAASFVRGLALSPEGFPITFNALPAFMDEASAIPDAGIMWNGPWREDVEEGTDAGTVPSPATLIASASSQFPYAPILVFGWRGEEEPHIRVPANPENSWRNAEAARLYIRAVTQVAREHHPPFLFLGNESDLYYDLDAEDYGRWVAVYEEAYDSVKAASPTTLVGPIVQYERTAGTGVLAGHTEPSWGAVTAHRTDRVDVFGITLYPFFAHATPEEVPATYLAPLRDRIGDTPIAITETGWPAEGAPDFEPPWEVSEGHQTAWLDRLSTLLEGHEVPLVSWVWLHPPVPAEEGGLSPLEWNIFHSLSLRRSDGTRRPVYQSWESFRPDAP